MAKDRIGIIKVPGKAVAGLLHLPPEHELLCIGRAGRRRLFDGELYYEFAVRGPMMPPVPQSPVPGVEEECLVVDVTYGKCGRKTVWEKVEVSEDQS